MAYFKLFTLSALMAGLFILPVSAQEKEAKPQTEKTPITEWIDAENALLDTLPAQNQKVFFVLRNKHSVIRTIGVVRRDIKNAVKACGKENADLKAPMNQRFKEWENAVLPILEEAEGFLETELEGTRSFSCK